MTISGYFWLTATCIGAIFGFITYLMLRDVNKWDDK